MWTVSCCFLYFVEWALDLHLDCSYYVDPRAMAIEALLLCGRVSGALMNVTFILLCLVSLVWWASENFDPVSSKHVNGMKILRSCWSKKTGKRLKHHMWTYQKHSPEGLIIKGTPCFDHWGDQGLLGALRSDRSDSFSIESTCFLRNILRCRHFGTFAVFIFMIRSSLVLLLWHLNSIIYHHLPS